MFTIIERVMSSFIRNVILILPLELLTFIVVPIALLFCKEEDTNLPKIARWWDDYNYGINGDDGWSGEKHSNGKQREYKWRLLWLFRNRLNTFKSEIMGVPIYSITSITYKGNPKVSNRPGNGGWLSIECKTDSGYDLETFYSYYIVYPYGSTGRCFRAYIGWKLKDSLNDYLENEILGDKPGLRRYAQAVFSVNPFMGYEVPDIPN